jgi:hypothetical protein
MRFKANLSLHGFKQIIKKPTRTTTTSQSLIDIIATNNPETIKTANVIPLSIGDHDMVGCVRKMNAMKFKPKIIVCRNYTNYDLRVLNDTLRLIDWSVVYNYSDVNAAWQFMRAVIMGVYERYAPIITKRVKGKPAPWISVELKKLMNERDSLLRRYRRTKENQDFLLYKQKRNEVNRALRQAKSQHSKNLLDENQNKPESCWRVIKSLYPTKSSSNTTCQSFEVDGQVLTDADKISNAFCRYFTSIVSCLKQKAFPLFNLSWRIPNDIASRTDTIFKFRLVSVSEVHSILKSLKCSKSVGTDNLPSRLLKDSTFTIAPPLTYIINLSLESGLIPNEWKSAKIVPIHKAGSRSIMDNFRPISVLPTISKVLERVVHRQLMSYLSDNKLLSEHQYGFRPKMSTELASIKLVDDIRLNVDKGNLVGAMFIDLTKAFDTVNHSQLLNKLPQYGVHGKELDWFKDYLFQRMVRVAYNGNLSQESYSFIGVPQG